jgi:hypothetical protein
VRRAGRLVSPLTCSAKVVFGQTKTVKRPAVKIPRAALPGSSESRNELSAGPALHPHLREPVLVITLPGGAALRRSDACPAAPSVPGVYVLLVGVGGWLGTRLMGSVR